ncbi:hypothetical protein OPV22_030983 [Ensete ventricosum]|uniref:Uncharacterized protein n=1 Tax=Ensete ventricosum TaxID=4639 RepID=A0AAV8PK98_ENSVE|nr:hypothetical protein OPV22_030983 [Ensete ventricosum]
MDSSLSPQVSGNKTSRVDVVNETSLPVSLPVFSLFGEARGEPSAIGELFFEDTRRVRFVQNRVPLTPKGHGQAPS